MAHLIIIGGDSRYLEVINDVKEKHRLTLIGYDNMYFVENSITSSTLEEADFQTADGILLPVHGTTETGEVTAEFSDGTFTLTKELIEKTPEHCVIYTGISNDFLKKAAAKRQMEIIFARDDIAIFNSISTAEATLEIAIKNTSHTIHGATVSVLGFGRVGFTVARLFQNVGATVNVYVRNSADIARITEMGMIGKYIANIKDGIAESSICINTIPQLMLDAETLNAMGRDVLVIDLASAPGGTDFTYAEEQGIKAIHALGLPGKTAPASAGKILADTILTLLQGNRP